MEIIRKTGTIIFILALLAFFTFIMVRNAWISDDSFITFRTVDNFVNGFGLTWNTGERVQAYTHPLWMFLVSFVYSHTREVYFTVIYLSLVVSFLAVAVYAYGIAWQWQKALPGITLLCLSKAFIDYTTSGLENPLTYLLFAGFFFIYYRFKIRPLTLFLLSFLASLCAVNRLDTILFFAPILIYSYVCSKTWIKGAAAILVGFLPFVCWTGFSLFYYGFPFPNTYYAKINTGIDQAALFNQGLVYFMDTIKNDPITIPVICIGVLSYFFTRDRRTIPASLGILAYCAYIFKIGGGFMMGRFFAVPFFCSVLLLSFAPSTSFKMIWAPALCIILFIGLRFPLTPVFSDETYKNNVIQDNGIADERGFYYQITGFLHAVKKEKEIHRLYQEPELIKGEILNAHQQSKPVKGEIQNSQQQQKLTGDEILEHFWITDGKELKEQAPIVAVRGYVGMMGYFAGPKVHFIDFHALTEPLLARIHIRDTKSWRIGHFRRNIPEGYVKTIETGENSIKDKHLSMYYEKLSLVVKGDLNSPERFKEIWNFNIGTYDHLLSAYRNEIITVPLNALSEPKETGSSWDSDGTYLFPKQGIHINLGKISHAEEIEVSLAYDYEYELIYYTGWIEIKDQKINPERGYYGTLSVVKVSVPLEISKRGFTDLYITPVKGNGRYSIGHLILKERNPREKI